MDIVSKFNTDKDQLEKKRVLFIPDAIWGSASGHRSAKFVVKAFTQMGVSVGVYASSIDYDVKGELECEGLAAYFEQTPYSYIHNLFPIIIRKEFLKVIKFFNPDFVFYMGTIRNKITMDICRKHGIRYSYLPLTTEYYCIKDFAGLEAGPCFQCMKKPIMSPFKNKCLGPPSTNILIYLKNIIFSIKSKPRILNANKIIGYSDNQLKYLEEFGAKSPKMLKMPIFFDSRTIEGITSRKGDYFVMAGQQITAKGWHIIPKIIKKSKNIRYKLIMKSKEQGDYFIRKHNLDDYVKSGLVEILSYLRTHREILELISQSRGVLVPSYYATTGEFYLLEALALGKPTVLFSVGIHSEVINHGDNSMIAPIGDFESFHDNVQKINTDDKLYEQLSFGSRKLFNDLTSLTKFHESVDEYFS